MEVKWAEKLVYACLELIGYSTQGDEIILADASEG